MHLDYGEYQQLVDVKVQNLYKQAGKYLGNHDIDKIKLAYQVAAISHIAQKRKSGEPYIIHPIEVATIISSWELDCATICGALLHDVVEDTAVTLEDITQIFGVEIAELVDSVTKLDKINFATKEIAYAEYFRKVVLSMAKDIRVILIKLADRLHNVLTLSSMKPHKQKRIALETMEIYVPIANKIGLHRVYLELAEECFKYLHPLRYKILKKAMVMAQDSRKDTIDSLIHNIRSSMKSNGINAEFIARNRTIYNIYKRMVRRSLNFDRIYDIFEIKIIVNSVRDCYLTLGVLHSLYQPFPGKFKDYIAIPKSNGYQSLHSTLMGPLGIPLQIHIRTETMEDVAENGIICHWLKNKNNDDFISAKKQTTNWINNILDIQASTFSANEFLLSIKQDLFPIDIYVFTPKGKIIILPKGATILDFAYFIHSDIGNHCSAAKVNSKMVKLDTALQNGDIVEIITNVNIEPTHEWLEIAHSGKAISKIKQYFKEQKYDENIQNGIKLINYSLGALGSSRQIDVKDLERVAGEYYSKYNILELEHEVGVGNISPINIAKNILNMDTHKSIEIKLSNCNRFNIIQDAECFALPDQKIITRVTRNGDMILHTLDCKQNKQNMVNFLAFVTIINDTGQLFLTKLHAILYNIPGTFTKFSGIIAHHGINIIELTQEHSSSTQYSNITVTVEVTSINQVVNLYNILHDTDFVNKIFYFNQIII